MARESVHVCMYVCMFVCMHVCRPLCMCVCMLHFVCTRWDGQMSRASVSHAGRLGDLNIADSSLDPAGWSPDLVSWSQDAAGSSLDPAGSNPGRVKPMTLKLILVAS